MNHEEGERWKSETSLDVLASNHRLMFFNLSICLAGTFENEGAQPALVQVGVRNLRIELGGEYSKYVLIFRHFISVHVGSGHP